MLIHLKDLKNAIFALFGRFFAYFLWEKGPKFFMGVQKFFSQKFDPKWFQIHLFEIPNSFWLFMRYFLRMLKKSFFPIFQYKLGFSEIHNLKKYSGPGFSLLGTNHKM